MAITFVQTNDTLAGGSTLGVAFTGNTTTGNTIVVFVAAGSNVTVSSIADTAGNTTGYVKGIAVPNPAPSIPAEIWYCSNATGGTTPTVTATLSGDGVNSLIGVYEFSGLATSGAADGTGASGTGTGTTLTLSSNLVTTKANDLLLAVCNVDGGTSAGPPGWTTETTFFALSYNIVSAAGSYPATFTGSGSTDYTIAAFALSAPVSGGTPNKITATIAAAATMGGGVKKVMKTSITI